MHHFDILSNYLFTNLLFYREKIRVILVRNKVGHDIKGLRILKLENLGSITTYT